MLGSSPRLYHASVAATRYDGAPEFCASPAQTLPTTRWPSLAAAGLRVAQMALAPFADRGDDRRETPARLGQAIFDLGRHEAIILACDQSSGDQRLEFAAEHARRDFRSPSRAAQQSGPDFAVAARSFLQVPQNPNFVFAADHR